jgi:hypothetical protein
MSNRARNDVVVIPLTGLIWLILAHAGAAFGQVGFSFAAGSLSQAHAGSPLPMTAQSFMRASWHATAIRHWPRLAAGVCRVKEKSSSTAPSRARPPRRQRPDTRLDGSPPAR